MLVTITQLISAGAKISRSYIPQHVSSICHSYNGKALEAKYETDDILAMLESRYESIQTCLFTSNKAKETFMVRYTTLQDAIERLLDYERLLCDSRCDDY